MKKEPKNRELVKAQMIDENLAVEAYCFFGYSTTGSSSKCLLGYSCNGASVSSPTQDDVDVLL